MVINFNSKIKIVYMIIEIVPIRDLDAKEWNDFVSTTSNGTFFCTTDWWAVFDDPFFLIGRNGQGEIISGIPFRLVSVLPLIGRFFQLCWTDSSALVRDGFDESEVFNLKRRSINALVDYLKGKAIVLIVSSKVRSSDSELFRSLGFDTEGCATLKLDLTRSENEILKSFSKGHIHCIRRAQKLGVQVKISEGDTACNYIQDYCKLQRAMFENKKGTYSDIYYKDEIYLATILKAKYNKVFVAIAYHNGEPTAGGIFVSYNNELYYYLGASDPALTRISFASHQMQYEITKYAKANGFIRIDMGNVPFSPDPADPDYGPYIFKKGFGGERYEYVHGNLMLNRSRYMFVWRLRKFENNRILRSIYKFLIKK